MIKLLKDTNTDKSKNELFAETEIDIAKYVGKKDQKLLCPFSGNLLAECHVTVK